MYYEIPNILEENNNFMELESDYSKKFQILKTGTGNSGAFTVIPSYTWNPSTYTTQTINTGGQINLADYTVDPPMKSSMDYIEELVKYINGKTLMLRELEDKVVPIPAETAKQYTAGHFPVIAIFSDFQAILRLIEDNDPSYMLWFREPQSDWERREVINITIQEFKDLMNESNPYGQYATGGVTIAVSGVIGQYGQFVSPHYYVNPAPTFYFDPNSGTTTITGATISGTPTGAAITGTFINP